VSDYEGGALDTLELIAFDFTLRCSQPSLQVVLVLNVCAWVCHVEAHVLFR